MFHFFKPRKRSTRGANDQNSSKVKQRLKFSKTKIHVCHFCAIRLTVTVGIELQLNRYVFRFASHVLCPHQWLTHRPIIKERCRKKRKEGKVYWCERGGGGGGGVKQKQEKKKKPKEINTLFIYTYIILFCLYFML